MGFIERTYSNTLSFLDSIGESQFGQVAGEVALTAQILSGIVVILVLLNMPTQVYRIDVGTSIVLIVKIVLVALFLQNWSQFNSVLSAMFSVFDSISSALLQVSTGSTDETNFASTLDNLIEDFSGFANIASGRLNILGSVLNGIMMIFIAVFGALATLVLIAARVVLMILISIAPLAIAATLLNSTKSYFETWLSAVVTMSLFPVIIAGVFASVVSMANSTLSGLDSDDVVKLGDIGPVMMVLVLSGIMIVLTPFIVTLITGSFQLGALSSRAGSLMGGAAGSGARATGRGLVGSRSEPEKAPREGGATRFGAGVAKDTAAYMASHPANPMIGAGSNQRGEQLRRQSERFDRFQSRNPSKR